MKSLKVSVNNRQSEIAAVQNGTVSVIVTAINSVDKQDLRLDLSGLDAENNKFKWLDEDLTIGDKIIIEVVENVEVSNPHHQSKLKPDATILDGKMRAYHILKTELEAEGLI